MGDRSPVHVFLYRTRIDMRRQEPDNSLTLLASIRGPVADSEDNPTVAIWSVQENETVPTARTLNNDASPTTVPSPAAANDIIFTSPGGGANLAQYTAVSTAELPETRSLKKA